MADYGTVAELIRDHEKLCRRIYSLPIAATANSSTASLLYDPWPAWNETVTTATTAAIWNVWTDISTTTPTVTGSTLYEVRPVHYLGQRVTPEQREAAQALAERRAAETLRIEGEKKLARQKAQALLEQHLDEAQRAQLRANGFFELTAISKNGERRRYRIHRGRHGNVRRLDEQGREVKRYCIHPMIACPDEDTMLTQKLWLENDEELFLRTANAS
jgi:hypothetical protein